MRGGHGPSYLFHSAVDLARVATIVRDEKPLECPSPGFLQVFQCGPALEKIFGNLRTHVTKPVQYLREIQLQMGTEALCEANSLVDELTPLFYQETKCSRFWRIGLNASQLVAMAN